MYKGFDKINLAAGSMSLNGFFNVDYPPGHLDGIEEKVISPDVTYRTPDAYMDCINLKEIPDGAFSYVRASHFLEHVCISKTRGTLKEWVRILAPGGTINIYDLGLIYDIKVIDDNTIDVIMTLTSPNCPVAESLPKEIANTIHQELGIEKIDIILTFDPPWSKDKLTELGKATLMSMGLL